MDNYIIGVARESVKAGDLVTIDMIQTKGTVTIKREEYNMNDLITTKGRKNILSEINKEIQADYQKKIKEIVKQKVKEIRMTEILLQRQKKELDEILSGKKYMTEEQILFGDN